MATEDFSAGLAELLAIAEGGRVAYMCAEAVSWRCQRRRISDCMVAKGHEVYDILSKAAARPQWVTPSPSCPGPTRHTPRNHRMDADATGP